MSDKVRYLYEHGISFGIIHSLSDKELDDLYLNVWEIWETNMLEGVDI